MQSQQGKSPLTKVIGKTRRFDHPSPEYDKLFKHQITRPFALSTRNGPKWSRGPFFPIYWHNNPKFEPAKKGWKWDPKTGEVVPPLQQ